MVERDITRHMLSLATQFKAVVVSGPRQSGKTTCVRHAFPGLPYVSF